MSVATHSLTDEQIAFFHREGYLTVDALTTPEDVAQIREIYDRLFASQAGRQEGNQFDLAGTDDEGKPAALPQILNPSKYAPELNETRLLVNATVVARQLLGTEAECRFAHAIYKPAKYGAETPWHQDASYWDPGFIHKKVSIWVPLQEATLENGCMQFVPRSHETKDVVEHQAINNDPRIHGLEVTAAARHEVKHAVACPLPAGGATFHGGYMLHYTGANRSEIPRRAIILMAGVAAEPRQTPLRMPWQERRQTAREERAAAARAGA